MIIFLTWMLYFYETPSIIHLLSSSIFPCSSVVVVCPASPQYDDDDEKTQNMPIYPVQLSLYPYAFKSEFRTVVCCPVLAQFHNRSAVNTKAVLDKLFSQKFVDITLKQFWTKCLLKSVSHDEAASAGQISHHPVGSPVKIGLEQLKRGGGADLEFNKSFHRFSRNVKIYPNAHKLLHFQTSEMSNFSFNIH